MRNSSPKEYLNLIERDNFSMIYNYQLKNTTTCPKNPTHNQLKLHSKVKGGTTYYK